MRAQLGSDWLPYEIEFMGRENRVSIIVRRGKDVSRRTDVEFAQWRTSPSAAYKRISGGAASR
ncbi:hypothetical protein [Methylorubrum extorquens]|uniref:hypothetical protein n=1 Tax=Methylorubrum extorquens TaxID=408 RepID=UPI001EE50AEE|nr:hypothetical protein [Methylorubrum extorquens]MCG5245132.1 hypothetical protein [Methylorubrum extorquens]